LHLILNEPWQVGEYLLGFILQWEGKVKKNSSNRYDLNLQNNTSPGGVTQLVVIAPPGNEIVEESLEPDSIEQIGDLEINFWEKEVGPNERFGVDVTIEQTQ